MQSRKIRRLVVTPIMTLLLLAVFWVDPLWILELQVQDAAFQNPGIQHPNIYIVGIDEPTLAEFGPFHLWSRYRMAQAIEILNSGQGQPAVIAVDILYAEAGYDENDAALVRAMQNSNNVVLASSVIMSTYGLDLTPVPVGLTLPFNALRPYVEHGIVNAIVDADGVIRNALTHIEFGGNIYYSFPASIAAMYRGHGLTYFTSINPEVFIHYTGLPGEQGLPGDFFEMSFKEIFQPDFDPDWYDGAVILIGPYALGMMDHHLVPTGVMYGVEIHANVLQMLLDGNYKLFASVYTMLAIVFALVIFAMGVGEFLDMRIGAPTIIGVGIGYWFLSLHIYEQGHVMQMLNPQLALALPLLYHIIYRYVIEATEKARLRNAFRKYVDASLADRLVQEDRSSDEIGQKRHIAILFADVRGFTPLSERLKDSPEQIVQILNDYLQLTSTAVFNNNGNVDKFIGDSTMALFNGFVEQEDYIYKAVKSAWDMKLAGDNLNEELKKQFGVDVGFGIGVHCGEAIVGNLGPSFRKDFTAIGDPVNTAARLESNAKPSQVLISEDVYKALEGRIRAERLEPMNLKGKSELIGIYSLTGIMG